MGYQAQTLHPRRSPAVPTTPSPTLVGVVHLGRRFLDLLTRIHKARDEIYTGKLESENAISVSGDPSILRA